MTMGGFHVALVTSFICGIFMSSDAFERCPKPTLATSMYPQNLGGQDVAIYSTYEIPTQDRLCDKNSDCEAFCVGNDDTKPCCAGHVCLCQGSKYFCETIDREYQYILKASYDLICTSSGEIFYFARYAVGKLQPDGEAPLKSSAVYKRGGDEYVLTRTYGAAVVEKYTEYFFSFTLLNINRYTQSNLVLSTPVTPEINIPRKFFNATLCPFKTCSGQ